MGRGSISVTNATPGQANFISDAAQQQKQGYTQFQDALTQQRALAAQLQAASQGQGPNPAQNMLNQATGQNVANQAALMAGQRGANANPGLIARQAGMQGANIQQQAIGQGATMGAQQQLAARQQLAGVNQSTLGAIQGQQGLSANILNEAAKRNSEQNIADSAAQAQMYGNIVGAMGKAAMLSAGGSVEQPNLEGPQSLIGQQLIGMHKGGKVPVMLSPGEQYLSPSKARGVAKGKEHPLSGRMIKGKAQVKGDSLKNDTVPDTLEEGGVVIPRSVMQSSDPAKKAAAFVKAVMARQRR